jgi:hypothetical protein
MNFKNLFLLVVGLLIMGRGINRVTAHETKPEGARLYDVLLTKFPVEHQGLGLDAAQKPGLTEQPMTYALVLSSEAIHYRNNPNAESKLRIQKALDWLIFNQDLNHDGIPGWGLPLPWDAFSDGTINDANHPYTITTSIVLNSFLDVLDAPNLITTEQRNIIKELLGKVMVHWSNQLWSKGYGGGYFWYSPNSWDNIFSINAPAMFLGSMARYLKSYADQLPRADYQLVESRADDLAKAIVATVKLRHGLPYWDYNPIPNKFNNRLVENDLVHQVYILWGVELYRNTINHISFPWSTQQSLQSLRSYWHENSLYGFPQDEKFNPKYSALWGVGAMIAFESVYGTHPEAKRCVEFLDKAYGPLPDLTLTPRHDTKVQPFYPRQASHALWGLAYYYFNNQTDHD